MEQSITFWENTTETSGAHKQRWYKPHLVPRDTSAKHRQDRNLRELRQTREKRKFLQVRRTKLERLNRDKRLQDVTTFVQEWGDKEQQEIPGKKQRQLSEEEQELQEFKGRLG